MVKCRMKISTSFFYLVKLIVIVGFGYYCRAVFYLFHIVKGRIVQMCIVKKINVI